MSQTDVHYNVECGGCSHVFTPAIRSPLWWKAWRRHQDGFLDAYRCTREECGCAPMRTISEPDAPFRVSGYNDLCEDFDVPFDTFVGAVRKFRELKRSCVVFISGVSEAVKQKIEWA